jgi:hypothetical protein
MESLALSIAERIDDIISYHDVMTAERASLQKASATERVKITRCLLNTP